MLHDKIIAKHHFPMDKCLAEPMFADGGSKYKLDIEPDDFEVQDTVTVVWEIA